jgi:hypothetical protein
MSAYMNGTRDGRSTFAGGFWTWARGWEVVSERLVRASVLALLVETDIDVRLSC